MKKSITNTKVLIFIIVGNSCFKVWLGDRNEKIIDKIYEGDYNGF